MNRIFFFCLITIILIQINLTGQTTGELKGEGYTVFYSPDSVVISEGYMVSGKPDGYWKNYYTDGILKSEGNRKNFLLDSIWRFYSEEGQLILEIDYEQGKKNGFRSTYQGNEIIRERFVQDVKQGESYVLSADLKIKSKIPFVDGLEEGIARDYDTLGNIIQLVYYKKGYVVERERINRTNSNGLRHGRWKWFFDDEIAVQKEGSYNNGLENGYWKEYDRDGNLISATKYVDGEKQEKAEELVKLDMRTDYFPSGKTKVVSTYTKDGIPEGVRREYNEAGEVEKSFIFRKGIIVAEGILTDDGKRQGFWKEFYPNGKLKATGIYMDDLREKVWEFYYQKGQLEQIGKYINGKPDSLWRWYHSNGKTLREEHFYNGLPDGVYSEFDDQGKLITTGEYLEGKMEGFWTLEIGDSREEGSYSEGLRSGIWKTYYPDGSLAFEGKYVDDLPNGKHQWWWPNGRLKMEAEFVMGRKSGELKKYNDDGTTLIAIDYKGGKEVKYDGISSDMEE
ncbi:MAG: hypothetical protein A2W85_13015 [Bacteroidetes bacterium GWF2_41_31]|nr:MAG: hypothetical protein A2W85_13015 [Bacteroidetes bacterium GWF2_41_31]